MALFARIESTAAAAAGRQAAGQDSAGRCSSRRARLAPKGKRVALGSDARNRKIWRPNLPGMANKPLKLMAVRIIKIRLIASAKTPSLCLSPQGERGPQNVRCG